MKFYYVHHNGLSGRGSTAYDAMKRALGADSASAVCDEIKWQSEYYPCEFDARGRLITERAVLSAHNGQELGVLFRYLDEGV